MTKQYVFPPQNWAEVSRGMLVSEEDILKELELGKIWYFYDTCALIHHSHRECGEKVIQYIKKNNGIVVLLQTVVMELASQQNNNRILEEHQDYIRKMMNNGIPVIFLPEEKCCTIIAAVMSLDRQGRNERFTYAVRHLRSGNSGVSRALDMLTDSERSRILSGKPVSDELGVRGIKVIREKKQTRDSMGEEMIFYCMIMLASLLIPMVVLSDDKSAFDRFYRTGIYIEEHYQRKKMQYFSSVHLCHMMYQQNIMKATEAEEFLKTVYGNTGMINFRGITAQDIMPEEQRVPIKDMVELICEDKELRILI